MSHDDCQNFLFPNPFSAPTAPCPRPRSASTQTLVPGCLTVSLGPSLAAQSIVLLLECFPSGSATAVFLAIGAAGQISCLLSCCPIPCSTCSFREGFQSAGQKQLELNLHLSRSEGREERKASSKKQKKCHLVVQDIFFCKKYSSDNQKYSCLVSFHICWKSAKGSKHYGTHIHTPGSSDGMKKLLCCNIKLG